MADIVKQILAKPIQLADQVTKASEDVNYNRTECVEIKAKTEKLAGLLRQAARASSDLYERPTRRIIDDTEQVLDKALSLVIKCRANGLRRVFTIIPQAAFRKTSQQLENSIGDVSWLLRVSTPADDRDDEYLGLPPIAANEPILCLIWEQIAILCSGSVEERTDSAASLVSLARDNDRYGKLIIEEGGVAPLLKLAKEGRMEGQENAARAIGLLGRDPESVEQIVNAGVCSVFAKILKEGHMKVQVVVAWAISELAVNHPKCQDHFVQNNTIRLLVRHLAFETIQEHSKYAIVSKQGMSIHTMIMANSNPNTGNNAGQRTDDDHDKHFNSQIARPMSTEPSQMHNVVTNTLALKTHSNSNHNAPNQTTNHAKTDPHQTNIKPNHHHHHGNQVLAGGSIKGRELEDPATKAQMKAMAARALWHLCAGNVSICKSITESRALLCFAVLLEKGADEVQYNSSMALMEIAAVAEQNAELRRSAFKPTSPACKAVVDQFLKIIEKANSDLLIPCVRAIGNLARTFRATETRMIPPLVCLLEDKEPEIMREVVIALTKFAETDNFLHVFHSKAIIDSGGARHLIQLVYFGEQMVQPLALILLGYIALHVPDNEALAQAEVLIVIEWASKQGHFMQDPLIDMLLTDAKQKLELYQSRGSRGYH
ncbi:Vacuolar protein [Actinidia chinensis var. chinensis]|uniref:Vacuolar protein n=1 Tax=Actinidia chinensis var. chinensis TaxID=1590841 RepID=A0A2R6RHJ8_ACTCC|nr:Vacuolar protein [Actinidia chinensis var. chinensis]